VARALTDSEARVLSLLLANTARDERERLRQSGLPRSTYHAARRRAYQEGWLKDRYVPSPPLFGYPEMTFAVLRPFADRTTALATQWGGSAGLVHAWIGSQFALGVFFHRSRKERDRAESRLANGSAGTPVAVLHPPPTPAGCPAFFDFEGGWSHLSDAAGARGYPRGLPALPGADPSAPSTWSPRRRWAARELLERPFVVEREGRPGHLVGPFGLPFAQQRLLAEGWVLHRVLAEPSRIPPFRGRRMDRVILVTGALRDGVAAEALFMTLTRDCRVFPFLFAVADRTVLLGGLGQAPGPSPTAPAPARLPVTPTLRRALTDIQVLDDGTAQVRIVVDHRYDRLTPPDPKGDSRSLAPAEDATLRDDRAARAPDVG
jgi:hypothetical protein